MSGRVIEYRDAVDESTAIGQVAVIAARLDAGLRHRVALPLEGTRRVHHPVHLKRAQHLGETAPQRVTTPTPDGSGGQGLQGLQAGCQLARIAPRNNQFDIGHGDQVSADDAAEITVRTDDQDLQGHLLSLLWVEITPESTLSLDSYLFLCRGRWTVKSAGKRGVMIQQLPSWSISAAPSVT